MWRREKGKRGGGKVRKEDTFFERFLLFCFAVCGGRVEGAVFVLGHCGEGWGEVGGRKCMDFS